MHVCVCLVTKPWGDQRWNVDALGMSAIPYSLPHLLHSVRREANVQRKKETREKAHHQAGLKNQRRHQTQNRSLVKALIARGITLAEMLLQAWCWFKTPVIMGQPGWRSESLTHPVLSYNVTMHLNWKNYETLVLSYSSAINEKGPSIWHPCHETNHSANIAMPTDTDYDITQIAETGNGLPMHKRSQWDLSPNA